MGIFGASDYFNGNIDDVRVHNRVLSLAEMQALVQQQNKRIYVTAQMYSGNLMTNGGVVGSPTGATGIAGADAKCNWASDTNKPATGTYKAMLGGGVANLRRACTSASCVTGGITENIDWVLRPNITYTRSTNLPIFTANWNGVWDFFGSAPTGGNFTNAIAASGTPWTGVTATWISDTACGSWDDTGGATDNKAVFGNATATSQTATPGGVIYQNWAGGTTGTFVVCGSSAYPLYCVEQ
ncbi:MAG: DUF1554 domain-containing protein [Spirochaetes bacterium]|nr:DUF1554 domain-containing protein [Spirochaetota bacterium]